MTMTTTIEQQIITKALDHPGLLSRQELEFVQRINNPFRCPRLTGRQLAWLYSIGERKLNMVFDRPERAPVQDYKARACA